MPRACYCGHPQAYGRWVQGIQVRALGSALAARSKASSGISKVRIFSTGSVWRTNSRSIAHPPYDASANSRDKYTVSSNRYPQASQDQTCRIQQSDKCSDHSGAMISARHCAHCLTITLVTDTSSTSAFLKLPARHGSAVTSGTPKPDCQQYRQTDGVSG